MSVRSTLRPATVAVVRHAFISGAEQMKRNLYRSAYSPVIYEMKDCSVGIFDRTGALLGQAPGLPFFLGSLSGTIREIAANMTAESEPGDVWLVNDSVICGSHLNDVTVVQPIFVGGDLLGFSGAKAHWLDVGAKDAGYVSDSTNIFQEGIRIPPTPIVRRGVIDKHLMRLLTANSRFGAALSGDLTAQIIACATGVERFRELVDRYGWPLVTDAVETFFAEAEAGDRAAVRAIPDGTYSSEGCLDDDDAHGEPYRVASTVTVTGDQMIIDLSGSADEHDGSMNCGIVQTVSGLQQIFKSLTNPNEPVCGGNFRNLEVRVPAGCFNPSPTAACLHYGTPLMLAMDLVVRALADVTPDRSTAGYVGDPWNVIFTNVAGRAEFVSAESLVGGWGGFPGGDGESALIHSAAGDFKNLPVETLEQKYPLRLWQHALLPDSGGAGQHCGGLGIVREYEALEPCRLTLWFERSKTPSWGLHGGQAGAPPTVEVVLPGTAPATILKVTNLELPAGSRVIARTGGGGGWGNPASRAVEAHDDDVRLGLISAPGRRDGQVSM